MMIYFRRVKMKKTASNIPLYAQIADELRTKIFMEEWVTGMKIPTEENLCESYHVSRITVRTAIDSLVNEGLVERKRAKGTFVTDWKTEKDEHFTLVRSFTDEMRELGKEIKTIHASISIEKANRNIAKLLNVSPDEKVMVMRRTRATTADEKPFVYFITYFKYRADFPTEDSAYYDSFYELLNRYHIQVNQSKEYIEAILPDKEIQEVLNITEHEPILKRVRITKQLETDFREYSECYYIGNKYRYYIDFS